MLARQWCWDKRRENPVFRHLGVRWRRMSVNSHAKVLAIRQTSLTKIKRCRLCICLHLFIIYDLRMYMYQYHEESDNDVIHLK